VNFSEEEDMELGTIGLYAVFTIKGTLVGQMQWRIKHTFTYYLLNYATENEKNVIKTN